MAVFGQKLLYSGKVVVIGHFFCMRAKLLFSGKSSFTREKLIVPG